MGFWDLFNPVQWELSLTELNWTQGYHFNPYSPNTWYIRAQQTFTFPQHLLKLLQYLFYLISTVAKYVSIHVKYEFIEFESELVGTN